MTAVLACGTLDSGDAGLNGDSRLQTAAKVRHVLSKIHDTTHTDMNFQKPSHQVRHSCSL